MMRRRLMEAILMEDIPKVEDLIRNQGTDVNVDIHMGDTPLVYAIEQNKYAVFKKLLELGADVNKTVPKAGYSGVVMDETPLMIAAKQEDERYTIELIQKGADINAQDKTGKTALMFAYIYEGPEETIRALLNAGANLEIEDEEKQTVLHFAVGRAGAYDSIHWLDMLFENGRTPNINHQNGKGDTPLLTSCVAQYLEGIKFLASKGANLEIHNNNGFTPLFYTIHVVYIAGVQALLEAGAKTSINTNGYNKHALIEALRNNPEDFTDIVKLLLDKGVDVNVIDETDDGRNDSPLMIAIQNDFDMDIIQILVDKGANVNYKNEQDDTPLLEAVYSPGEEPELLQFLIEKGADVNVVNSEGMTPLMVASINRKLQTVRVLVDNGANVNFQDEDGETSLFNATKSDHVEIAKLLLEKGANPNIQTAKGYSPLMIAVNNGNIDLVKLLLENGANKTLRDKEGKTAIDHANEKGNEEIIALLSGTEIEMWKGYTKADAEFFNPILDNRNNLNDQSICPFCLQYTEREANCKYMSHICRPELRHERLYNLYKNSQGYVVWCAVCGRHCYGHGHFSLTNTTETVRPNILPFKPGADVYNPESCPLEGGGGPDEKIKRIDGLLRYVCEVQDDVGKRPAKKVREELIEETWKAASSRAPKTVRDIRAAKKFNIPCGLPSATTSTTSGPPDIPNPNPMPVKKGPGMSSITLDDCDETYEFVHKQPDGSLFTHQLVCKDDLRNVIKTSGGSEDKCPIEPECKGVLHPDEIKDIFADDVEFYENYKIRFNEKNKVGGARRKQSRRKTYRNKKFRGGADGPGIVSKMTDAICALPEKKTAGRKTYKKKSKSKRSTRRQS